MKRTILFIGVFAIGVLSTIGQEANIADISRKVQSINEDTAYIIIKMDNEDFLDYPTDGGKSLIGYFKKDTVCKITEFMGLSYGNLNNEYFFNNGALVYVHEKEEVFIYNDSLSVMDYSKIKTGFEGHYYFGNEKIVHSDLLGERRIEDKPEDSEEKGRQLLHIVNMNLKLLAKKRLDIK